MAEITAALVKQLRDATGAGMMECKAALTEANGDLDDATTLLRKRGLAQATKKAGRSTTEGLIGTTSTWAARSASWWKSTASPTSSRAPTSSRTWSRRSRCTSPPQPARTCGAKTSPRTISSASARSTSGQMEGRTSRPPVIDKIVEGKLNSFYEQFVPARSAVGPRPQGHYRPARPAGHRQARREHHDLRGSSASSWARRRRQLIRPRLSTGSVGPRREPPRVTGYNRPRYAARLPPGPAEALRRSPHGRTAVRHRPRRRHADRQGHRRDPAARRADRRRHRRRQHVPRAGGERARAWTARRPTTWACSPR